MLYRLSYSRSMCDPVAVRFRTRSTAYGLRPVIGTPVFGHPRRDFMPIVL